MNRPPAKQANDLYMKILSMISQSISAGVTDVSSRLAKVDFSSGLLTLLLTEKSTTNYGFEISSFIDNYDILIEEHSNIYGYVVNVIGAGDMRDSLVTNPYTAAVHMLSHLGVRMPPLKTIGNIRLRDIEQDLYRLFSLLGVVIKLLLFIETRLVGEYKKSADSVNLLFNFCLDFLAADVLNDAEPSPSVFTEYAGAFDRFQQVNPPELLRDLSEIQVNIKSIRTRSIVDAKSARAFFNGVLGRLISHRRSIIALIKSAEDGDTEKEVAIISLIATKPSMLESYKIYLVDFMRAVNTTNVKSKILRAVNAHEEIDVNGFAIPVALIRYDGGAHKKAAAAAVSDLNRRMMKCDSNISLRGVTSVEGHDTHCRQLATTVLGVSGTKLVTDHASAVLENYDLTSSSFVAKTLMSPLASFCHSSHSSEPGKHCIAFDIEVSEAMGNLRLFEFGTVDLRDRLQLTATIVPIVPASKSPNSCRLCVGRYLDFNPSN